jgi:hypothetical protein
MSITLCTRCSERDSSNSPSRPAGPIQPTRRPSLAKVVQLVRWFASSRATLSIAASLDAAHVDLDGRLAHLQQVASAQGRSESDPNALYRALASFTAEYLEHLAVEEGEALPVLWEHCSDQELLGIVTSFRGSRSPLENLTSLLAQLPTLNPLEATKMVSLGVDPTELPAIAELVATILQPAQLRGLQSATGH